MSNAERKLEVTNYVVEKASKKRSNQFHEKGRKLEVTNNVVEKASKKRSNQNGGLLWN